MNNYQTYPLEQALSMEDKRGLVHIFRNRYWIIREGNLLFWRGYSPQCNAVKSIAERLAKEDCEVVFLERVFIPMREGSDGLLYDF